MSYPAGYWVCPRCKFRYDDWTGKPKRVICPECADGKTVLMIEVVMPEIPCQMTEEEYEDSCVQDALDASTGDVVTSCWKLDDDGKGYIPLTTVRSVVDVEALERIASIMRANEMEGEPPDAREE